MSPNDIVEEVRKQPFQAFELHSLDGTSYVIRHPDQCMVLLTSVIIGVPGNSGRPYFQRTVKLDCRLISRIEPVVTDESPIKPGEPPTLNA